MDEQAKRLLGYAAEIKDYCRAHDRCDGCPFTTGSDIITTACVLDYSVPAGWWLEDVLGKEG